MTPGLPGTTPNPSEGSPFSAARPPLTDEQLRILRAIQNGTFGLNSNGRYIIVGEARPDRKSRERLRGRGLIEHFYEQGRGTQWRVTARGKRFLDA